jgi:hypothetical protein
MAWVPLSGWHAVGVLFGDAFFETPQLSSNYSSERTPGTASGGARLSLTPAGTGAICELLTRFAGGTGGECSAAYSLATI